MKISKKLEFFLKSWKISENMENFQKVGINQFYFDITAQLHNMIKKGSIQSENKR